MMSADHNKENIADGVMKSAPGDMPVGGLRKKDKSRSASMGPGAKAQVSQESKLTRRKSMMPAVKSILSAAKENKTDEDEAAKRKALRRKSLANRRVSFAPEATLHTWDVIEYMKDATSSSASSEEARRASSLSRGGNSSPTTQLESENETTQNTVTSKTAANDVHGSADHDSTDDEDDMGDATMELDETVRSNLDHSSESTSSSSKLDNALRQATAAAQANTQNLSLSHAEDKDEDQTMYLVRDEVTSAFRPWYNSHQSGFAKRQSTMADQENLNPFRAVQDDLQGQGSDEESNDDATMDVTVAVGGIIQQQLINDRQSPVTKSATSRRSHVAQVVDFSGSPVSRPATRRSMGRRRSVVEPMVREDATMDLTMAIGGIRQVSEPRTQNNVTDMTLMDATMDLTMAVGSIKSAISRQDPEDISTQLPNTEVLEDLSMELTANLGQTIAEAINVIAPSPAKKQSAVSQIAPFKTETLHFDRLLDATSSSQPPKEKAELTTPTKPATKVEASTSAATTPSSKKNLATSKSLPEISTPTHPQAGKASAPKSSIADGLRMLATPRKEILPTPKPVRTSQNTPKQASQKKGSSPRKRPAESAIQTSPQKRVRMEVPESTLTKIEAGDANADLESEPIGLSDFLGMTGIKFMDLTTTKRRATGFPGADAMLLQDVNNTIDELEPSTENKIVAAVATQPMLQMYQHSCTEMKSYIASGRTEIKTIEASAIESRPPLFYDYANASFAEKAIMDNQLRDLKTNARLQSKSSWHTWRSQLLNDLKKGLLHTSEELHQDERLLESLETEFAKTVPEALRQEEDLQMRVHNLQQRKADVDNGVEADLQRAREQLLDIQKESTQRQALLQVLRAEVQDVQSQLEDARSWKSESLGAIKEADRVSEECRGWSSSEVFALNSKVESLQSEFGWKMCSADAHSVTLGTKDLIVQFDPKSWLSRSNAPLEDAPNSSISISCCSASDTQGDAPLATIRRFFLQYIRAQAYSLPQSCTRISHLLRLLQNGWNLADRILSATQGLETSGRTAVQILNDDALGIHAFIFLPMLQTKVRIDFVIGVSTNAEDAHVRGNVEIAAQVVYGERYDEPKMASFLQQFVSSGQVGSEADVLKWAHGMDDLKDRLIRTGRKGVRRV